MKTCTINDCNQPILAKSFCRKHYLRQYKYGDPNTVKDRKDYILRGAQAPHFKHGHWDHPLYKVWNGMMRRCYNPNEKAYKNYGERGIRVCDRWHDLRNFIADMGERPIGFSIDRIDNNKDYCLENCRWANDTTQSRNRRYAKLSTQKAQAIRDRRSSGAKRKELAIEFGVSEATIKKVLSGAYWV